MFPPFGRAIAPTHPSQHRGAELGDRNASIVIQRRNVRKFLNILFESICFRYRSGYHSDARIVCLDAFSSSKNSAKRTLIFGLFNFHLDFASFSANVLLCLDFYRCFALDLQAGKDRP